MMNRMIVGNLVYRPIRSLISIVAVALEVTLHTPIEAEVRKIRARIAG